MPIRTKHHGVLGLVFFAALLIVSIMGFVPTASAHYSSNAVTVKKTSTTKGVRTKTAYQKRRTVTRYTYYRSYRKGKYTTYKRVVALPPEIAPSSVSGDIAARAVSLVGSRYRWGGTSPQTGFDCTGLVTYVYGERAKRLPRSAAAMYYAVGKTRTLRPGDIVFFGRGRARHAAIYIGGGKIVHASTPRTGVRVDSFATIARALGFMGAGRLV